MFAGFSAFTFVQVLITLVGIVSGLAVLFGMLNGRRLDGWTLINAPPFAAAQELLFILFIVAGVLSFRRFRPA
jgi:hypothetical protein